MGLNANMLTGFAGDVIVYTVIIIIRLIMRQERCHSKYIRPFTTMIFFFRLPPHNHFLLASSSKNS